VILFDGNKPIDFIPIKYDLEMKFRDIKQIIYLKKQIGFDVKHKELLLKIPHNFFYCEKKMDETFILENENIKSESILLLKPNKKAIFKNNINKILQRHIHYTDMGIFDIPYLKKLSPFTIIPYLTQNVKIHIDISKNGLQIVKLFWQKQHSGMNIKYCYGTAFDRMRNYSAITRMCRFWILEANTSENEIYTLTNVYVNIYPVENKIELRQLQSGKYLLLDSFKNIKGLTFYSESGGISSVIQNFKLLPKSMMKHQIRKTFWKEKKNLTEIVVTIFVTILLLVLYLKIFSSLF